MTPEQIKAAANVMREDVRKKEFDDQASMLAFVDLLESVALNLHAIAIAVQTTAQRK